MEIEISGRTLEDINNEVLFKRLQELNWNRSKTADSLGISRRNIFDRVERLKLAGFEIPKNACGRPASVKFAKEQLWKLGLEKLKENREKGYYKGRSLDQYEK